ncbi:MAG TPA: peptidoglycan DD-metalloendopeptidase family protein [bacterium]|nr:peptidoglycan DD-metalloendopeptidase family protein [bacterium]
MSARKNWRLAPAILAAAIILFSPSPSTPAPLDAAGQDQAARELEGVRARMDQEKKALAGIMKKQGSVLEKLEALKNQLRRSEQRLFKLEREREILAADSRELAAGMKDLAGKVEKQRRDMGRRLRARYRFGRAGAISVLLSAQSLSDLSRRARYLDVIFRVDRARISDYNALLSDWRAAEERLLARQESLKSLEAVAREQREQLADEKQAQTRLLSAIREEKSAHEAMLEELQAAAARLSGVIASLDRGAGAVEDGDSVEGGTGAPFAQLRGKLCQPAPGPVRSGFGIQVHPKFNTEVMQNGIEIGAAAGARVRAVAPGVVRFAEWFRGYGNLVIIDHGQGYYTIYAHLAEIRASVGASVRKGSVVGTVGDTGSLSGPSLYFEVRRHEKPLDPALWLGNCSG